jgi:acyl-coenzyme A synthetase/AMP-(fatty) acid ligase
MRAVRLEQDGDTTHASGGHVEGRVPLGDIIETCADGRFLLHGRHADLINIAGKRTSLAYLNHQLGALPGVIDAAFFLPDAPEGAEAVTRLAAFVVAPTLDARTVMAGLRPRLDAIFLPRPLVLVEALPRNSTGKLTRQALQALYDQQVGHGQR